MNAKASTWLLVMLVAVITAMTVYSLSGGALRVASAQSASLPSVITEGATFQLFASGNDSGLRSIRVLEVHGNWVHVQSTNSKTGEPIKNTRIYNAPRWVYAPQYDWIPWDFGPADAEEEAQ